MRIGTNDEWNNKKKSIKIQLKCEMVKHIDLSTFMTDSCHMERYTAYAKFFCVQRYREIEIAEKKTSNCNGVLLQ